MASTISEFDFNVTEGNNIVLLNDIPEYILSLKIHLYTLPVLLFIGIPGNFVSFAVLVFSSFRKSTTSIYLATISILDTIILTCGILWLISFHQPQLRIFQDISCQFIHFTFYFSIHFDVLLLVAVTVERFIVVVYPLQAQDLVSMKRAVTTIVALGLFSLALNLHHFFTKGMITSTSGKEACWISGNEATQFFVGKIYPWIDSFIYCILPLTSLFILNAMMITTMRKATQKRQSLQNTTSGESPASQRQVTIMLLLVSFVFLFLTGPMGIILMLDRYTWIHVSTKQEAVARLIHSIVDNMMYANHAVNFIFYCMSGQRFRNELKRTFCLVLRSKRNATETMTPAISKTSSVDFGTNTTLEFT